MGFAGFRSRSIRYDMFDLDSSAAEARRLVKCENIYHRGQELTWDGRDILGELLAQHGGVVIDPARRQAIERIFTIILWGELAAWRISAQLADLLVPLEAKMAATSQAHDEARHFYVMHQYLRALGCTPGRLDRAPQALLDLVLDTADPVRKLLGMQLQIETLALTIFQAVREVAPEPVITELMRYYERDEARHVGLGMQYLPLMMAKMSRPALVSLVGFQTRVMFWAMWEAVVLAPDLRVLGLDPRVMVERARSKQLAALGEALRALGVSEDKVRSPVLGAFGAAIEILFPTDETASSRPDRWRAAWRAFRAEQGSVGVEVLDEHARHRIRTVRGMAEGERAG